MRTMTTVAAVILAGVSARAAGLAEKPWMRLARPCLNCACQMFVVKAHEDGEAVDRMRALRIKNLGLSTVEPLLVRNFNVDDSLSQSSRERLAAHIRGIELWLEDRFQERVGIPRLSSSIYSGNTAIEQYYKSIEDARAMIKREAASDAEHVFRMFKRNAAAAGGGLLLSIMALADYFGRANGIDGLIPWQTDATLLVLLDPVAAVLPRFARDPRQESFDEALQAYLNLEPEAQKKAWLYSSIQYRIQWSAVDAIESGDQHEALAGLKEISYVKTFGPILQGVDRLMNVKRYGEEGRIRNRNLQRGFVYLDRYLSVNQSSGVPELIVIVRTMVNIPRDKAPVSDPRAPADWRGNAQIATPRKAVSFSEN